MAPKHDEVSQYVIPLVASIQSRRLERLDKYSATKPGNATVGRIADQRVRAGRVDDYLEYRRTVIHPSMEDADGFVGAWVFAMPDDPERLLIYFQWESEDAYAAYFNAPYHLGEITDRVKEMVDGRLGSAQYSIVEV